MMKKILLITALICSISIVSAQKYKTGIGIRAGSFSGLTLKHFMNDINAVEGIVSWRWNGFVVSGLYEFQKQLNEIPELDWFIGGGAHIGFWDGDNYKLADPQDDSFVIVGADFILGLEYTFKEVPFSISIDWKPGINIIGDSHVWADAAGLSFRYHLK